MNTHDEHSSFIKTPRQLVTIVLLALLVPIVGIVLVVELVLSGPSADPAALAPQAVAERIQPVGRVEFGGGGANGRAAARSGEEIVKSTCGNCHVPGVADAPRIGDAAAWGKLARQGIAELMRVASQGKGAMPPRGGLPDLSDAELARAIVTMANQSGLDLKVPAAPAAKK